MIAAVSIPLASAKEKDKHEKHGKMEMKKRRGERSLSLEKIHSGHLPMVSESIDKAIKAIEADKKETALAELHKAQKMLAVINAGIAKHIKPKFANVSCPIMGSPIDPNKVPQNLTCEYKGQKVAFCCGGCPTTWDKLSDAEKDAKLAKVKPTLQKVWTCSMHPQIKLPKPGSCPICKMDLIPLSKK